MRFKAFLLLFTSLVLVFVIAACGNEGASVPEEAEAETEGEETIQKEFDPNDQSDWPSSVRMGTGSIGGTYYIYGGGWGDIVSEHTGVDVSIEVTGGPVHNIQLIEAGDLELGMVTMGPAWEAWYGEGDWTGGNEIRSFRVMFPMYTTYFHWWAPKRSGIESIYDFPEGANIGVGPSGGTPGTYLPQFLELLGVNVNPAFAGIGDLSSQVLDGLLPATGFAAGIPFAAAVEAEAQQEMNFFGFSEEDVQKIIEEFPFFSEAVIPAGTYNSQTEDMYTVGIWNMAVAHKDMPDSFVYKIVDSVLNNHDKMMQIHSASEETIAENIKHNTFVYMHPGAIRWFEEQGIELPDEVYPPEYSKQ